MLFHSQIYNIKSIFSIDFKVNETVGKKVLSIPFYQRSYVWSSEEALKLLQDILNAFEENSNQYFLGGIVLSSTSISEKEDYIDIVDGQQRTMTIAIILATLYNFLQHKKEDFYKNSGIKKDNIDAVYNDSFEILKTLVVTHVSTLTEGTNSYFKIQTSENIREAFEGFIDYLLLSEQNTYNEINSFELDSTVKNKQTYDNIIEVGKVANDFYENFLDDILKLEKFVPYLLNNVLLVGTITDDLKNAFMIFETLNDRGVGLSPDDLIKSHLIQNVTKQYEELSKLWDTFIDTLRDKKGKFILKPLEFFDYLFLSEGEVVKQEDVYTYFTKTYITKHKLDNDKRIKEFLEKLINLAEYYINNKQKYSTLSYLHFGMGSSTLFSLYKIRMHEEQMKKFVKLLERISVVYFMTGKSKEIKKDLSLLNKIIFEGFVDVEPSKLKDSISTIYKKSAQKIKELIERKAINFENSIIKMNIPKSGIKYRQVRYLLVTMANSCHAQFDINSDETTIEHLMPLKKPTPNCFIKVPDDKYSIFNKRIGNLTIMNKSLNQKMGSDCFNDKINVIEKQQPDFLTYSLFNSDIKTKEKPYGQFKHAFNYKRKNSDLNIWDIDEIENRSEALARLAKFIWVDGNL